MQRDDEKRPTTPSPATRPTPPRPDEERVWLAFAQSAVSGFTSIDGFTDNMGLSIDAARIADAMIVQWRKRFDPPEPTPPSTTEPTF